MKAYAVDKSYWINPTIASVTINIEGIDVDDIDFLVNFLNVTNDPVRRIREWIDKESENKTLVTIIGEKEAIELKDKQNDGVPQVGSIESLEL
jgi:hypothetical protein